jgi:hypothetical protein
MDSTLPQIFCDYYRDLALAVMFERTRDPDIAVRVMATDTLLNFCWLEPIPWPEWQATGSGSIGERLSRELQLDLLLATPQDLTWAFRP